jgi:DNA repair protein SbcD/Mre11
VFKFIHAADLHIDSPLVGLERYEGAPVEQIRKATRRAFENLVQLCISEQAQLLILAGDLFDGDWRDYSTGLYFVGQMQRLRQVGIPVVVVRGNHDAASQITQRLSYPSNVTEFSADVPQTIVLEQAGLAVHGQSYAHRAELRDLSSSYPEPRAGYLNIGVLHTAVTGRPGHEPYAPCRLETLHSKGYHYWALGHVHEREVLSAEPWVVFPGNLQARHMKEPGPKGATVVSYREGRIERVEHHVLDVVRFASLRVDVSDAKTPEEVVDAAFDAVQAAWASASERTLVVRVGIDGVDGRLQELHRDIERWTAEVRARATELPNVWIERVKFAPLRERGGEALQDRGDLFGQILQAIQAVREGPELRAEFLSEFIDIKNKLPAEVRYGEGNVRLDDPDLILELVDDVEELVRTALFHPGDG